MIEPLKNGHFKYFFSCKIATIDKILKFKAKKSLKKSSQVLIKS
mgnify:CR=1 FL=1